jgi:hypothetical protein
MTGSDFTGEHGGYEPSQHAPCCSMAAASPLASSTTRSRLGGGEWDRDQAAPRCQQGRLGDGVAHPDGFRAAWPLGARCFRRRLDGLRQNQCLRAFLRPPHPADRQGGAYCAVVNWLTVVLGKEERIRQVARGEFFSAGTSLPSLPISLFMCIYLS